MRGFSIPSAWKGIDSTFGRIGDKCPILENININLIITHTRPSYTGTIPDQAGSLINPHPDFSRDNPRITCPTPSTTKN